VAFNKTPPYSYGPFKVGGKFTTASNEAFDADLRERNAAWGYRDVAEVGEVCAAAGLESVQCVDMPANNHTLIFKKQ
jgi:hypothetical protein